MSASMSLLGSKSTSALVVKTQQSTNKNNNNNNNNNNNSTTIINNDKDTTNQSEVLIFENGTVLGAVSLSDDFHEIKAFATLTTRSSPAICDNSESDAANNLNENESLLGSSDNDTNRIEILNRSNSDSTMFENSILNEFQQQNQQQQQQQQSQQQLDVLNSSTCSRDSRQSKRTKRKQKKCGSQNRFPPQYTAIYLDANNSQAAAAAAALIHTNGNNLAQITPYEGGHLHSRLSVPISHRPVSEVVTRQGCFRQWFSRPSLPFVIGILALGGVACTLGGIVLGSTGLIEHSTQYLSAALLMIGIGVSLLVISGAIWKLSLPDDVDECPCFRHMETCRNCNSPFCGNRIMSGGYQFYPEFQHRPPPPSYLTSLNECAALGFLFHHDVSAVPVQLQRNSVRVSTPPPLYRSSNSLSVYVPINGVPESLTPNTNFVNSIVESPSINGVENSSNKDPAPTYIQID